MLAQEFVNLASDVPQRAEQPGMSISCVAKKYEVHPNQLFKWRRLMQLRALSGLRADEAVVPASEVK